MNDHPGLKEEKLLIEREKLFLEKEKNAHSRWWKEDTLVNNLFFKRLCRHLKELGSFEFYIKYYE